jgi:hypothetical protein
MDLSESEKPPVEGGVALALRPANLSNVNWEFLY